MRVYRAVVVMVAAVGAAVPTIAASGAPAADPRADMGAFSAPFEEAGPACVDHDGHAHCKPAGASQATLVDGRIVYWDALEGEEDVGLNTVAEYGAVAQNDQTRILDLRSGRPKWSVPKPEDGGANPDGGSPEYLPIPIQNDDDPGNNGDLFCSDLVQLADGRILAAGGTAYYLEPGMSGVPYGVTELEGLKNARIFDPRSGGWKQTGSMTYGRWYPSLVTMPDSKVFVASGVTKLIKPFYPTRPMDSGRNVVQTEVYDPKSGTWTVNPSSANKSLPLYPRLHLLPNGHVYYDAAGQTFNPDGQAYDEPLWNFASSYDPVTQSWTDLGVPGLTTEGGLTTSPGFRGSSFSVMLPLRPPYDSASFLSAGGVMGVTPGSYLATSTSQIATVYTTEGDRLVVGSTGAFQQPRWYSTAVALPTGEVLAFNGADRDEVVGPGSGMPVMQAELFDPASATWRTVATQGHPRTYHNTAVLMADGRVLVGGHAPINTGYAFADNTGHEVLGLSPAFRDPSFEIFSPPYLFRGPRPVIRSAPATFGYGGKEVRIAVSDAAAIDSVVLVRNPALTHIDDGDQRTVELPILRRDKTSVVVRGVPHGAVAPPGPYMLFVNKKTSSGLVPSVSKQVFVKGVSPAIRASVATPKPVVPVVAPATPAAPQVREVLVPRAGATSTLRELTTARPAAATQVSRPDGLLLALGLGAAGAALGLPGLARRRRLRDQLG